MKQNNVVRKKNEFESEIFQFAYISVDSERTVFNITLICQIHGYSSSNINACVSVVNVKIILKLFHFIFLCIKHHNGTS